MWASIAEGDKLSGIKAEWPGQAWLGVKPESPTADAETHQGYPLRSEYCEKAEYSLKSCYSLNSKESLVTP